MVGVSSDGHRPACAGVWPDDGAACGGAGPCRGHEGCGVGTVTRSQERSASSEVREFATTTSLAPEARGARHEGRERQVWTIYGRGARPHSNVSQQRTRA